MLKGTARTFDAEVRDLLERKIETLLDATCRGADAPYEYTYFRGYPSVITHAAETEFVGQIAAEVKKCNRKSFVYNW